MILTESETSSQGFFFLVAKDDDDNEEEEDDEVCEPLFSAARHRSNNSRRNTLSAAGLGCLGCGVFFFGVDENLVEDNLDRGIGWLPNSSPNMEENKRWILWIVAALTALLNVVVW